MREKVSIKALLEGVEVEWKSLKNLISTVTAPLKVKKSDYKTTGKIPIIDQGQGYIAGFIDEIETYVKSDYYIIFGDHSEHIKYVDFAFVQGADGLKILKPNEDIAKYIYYAFQNNYQKEFSYKRHWANAKETLIPIPPLKIQSEIVRILDNFTELTAELTARKKQYQFYRDKLLSFEDGEVEWKRLGEVAKIKNGRDWKKLGQGNIPVYGSGGIMGFVDTPIYSKVSILIPRKGTITNIFYTEEPFWNVDTIFYTIINEDVIFPKYFYYFMSNYNLSSLSTDSTRPSLTQTILNKILIPVPPLSEQQKIVSILDKFDTLTNSISEGLPREIELRQKQYEYYRDLLLTFPKNDVKAEV